MIPPMLCISLGVLGAIVGLLCVLRRYADLIASSRPNGGGVFGDYVTNGCDGDPDQGQYSVMS